VVLNLDKEKSQFLLKKYFEEHSFTDHNILSFNKFVRVGLQKIVDEVNEVVPDILPIGVRDLRIKLGKIWVEKPIVKEADGSRRKIMPVEARLRNLTYEAPILLEMSILQGGEEKDKQTVQIGNLPIMLRSENCYLSGMTRDELIESGEDPDDQGGYFIINGTERVVVIVEDLVTNKVLVDEQKIGPYPYTAKIFSEDGQYNIPHTLEKAKDGIVYVTFSKIHKIPFSVLLKALGSVRDKDIIESVSMDEKFASDLYINLYEVADIKKPADALDYIGKKMGIMIPEKRVERAEELVDKFLFPHIGHKKEDRPLKMHFLAYAVKKLLMVSYGDLRADDKDHYSNKRLRLCGDNLETLFRFSFKMVIGDMKYNFERLVKRGKLPNLHSITRSQLLTSRLRSALATGEWIGERHGISQHLDRLNYYATLSHLRRVVSLLTASRENFEARDLHPTHWGKLCTSETPEGVNVGLRKNLAITCEISTEPEMSKDDVIAKLKSVGMEKGKGEKMVVIYLDGKYIGEHKSQDEFIKSLREMRTNGNLPFEINYSYSKNENSISVFMDKGRARRPLLVVQNGIPLITEEHFDKLNNGEIKWSDLAKLGVVEYLDAEEEENTLIAIDSSELTPEHTHLEVSPTVIMGAQANMVPYAQHSVSYRVTLGAKMSKQSIGIYCTNIPVRSDTDVSILHYPQVPIVKTQMYDLVKYEMHPAGQNVVVAVMPWDGYNMNDAVVLNKASIDRGLFRATVFRPYKCEELKYPGGQSDEIRMPDKDIKGYRTDAAYSLLEEDGIIAPEAEVGSGDVLVGKVSPPRFLASLEEFKVGTEAQRETSTTVVHSEKGVVDNVLVSESEEGNRFIKVKLRNQRIPEIGDKFASRHGQKGVIGIIVPEEDMPFTADGIVPDIIFSPHSIPSRMTVGHLIELIGGKVGALTGKQIDATAFQSVPEFELRKMLLESGFREDGSETMYDGRTGEQLEARVFVGNQYYYRLRHMVANKMHARSRGPVQLLTRQPTEGRAKEGGLRLGEMEKDCFVAHGAALLLKERFDSDRTIVPVCKQCGMVAVHNRFKNTNTCPIDGDDAPVTFIEMSYAFKLLLDELKSMCIYPKLVVKPKY